MTAAILVGLALGYFWHRDHLERVAERDAARREAEAARSLLHVAFGISDLGERRAAR